MLRWPVVVVFFEYSRETYEHEVNGSSGTPCSTRRGSTSISSRNSLDSGITRKRVRPTQRRGRNSSRCRTSTAQRLMSRRREFLPVPYPTTALDRSWVPGVRRDIQSMLA
jgi:hypothetical protein